MLLLIGVLFWRGIVAVNAVPGACTGAGHDLPPESEVEV